MADKTYRIRADVHQKGKNCSHSFSEYSRNTFTNEIDAWNNLDSFKNYIKSLCGPKDSVKCYVSVLENGKEVLMCKGKI